MSWGSLMSKAMKFINSGTGTIVAIGVVGGLALYYAEKKAKQVAQAVAPTNDENIFNQGVLAVGRKITGNERWTLGGWIYDVVHGRPNIND